MVISIDMQLLVALLAGAAAAMLVSPVRRSVPRWMEAAIWLGLIGACWLAVTSVKEANVRYLTESMAWGVDQIVKTSIGLMFAAVVAWTSDHRYPIAYAVVMLLGADAMLVAMLRTHRQAEQSLPRIMLGEWIELPLHPVPARAEVPYAMDEWNRRAERAAAMLGVAFLTWLVNLMIWARDVFIAQVGARLHASQGMRLAGRVFRRVAFGEADQALTDEQVISVSALLRAQSIGWYSPIVVVRPGVASNAETGQEDEPDRLAS